MAKGEPTNSRADAVTTNRLPPYDLEAEMSVLGSMMLDRQAIESVLPVIHRDESNWFYRPDHQLLFEVLVELYDRGQPIDLVIVSDELRRHGQLDQVGGQGYIIRLCESVPTWVNAEYYAGIVRDKGLLRDLIQCAGQINEAAYDQAQEVRLVLDDAEQRLFRVTERRVSGQATSLGVMLQTVYKQLEVRDGYYITGLETGFFELDDITSGLQLGDMIVVAGRPSMGKTTLGLNIAEHLAVDNGVPVAFFSLEMSKQQLAQRILCSRGRIDSHRFRRGMINEEEIQELGLICGQLASAPLYIDDTPAISALELRSKARRLRQRHEIAAVFVDYLQLMTAPSVARDGNRQIEIASISGSLKALARELNIPVVAMAQLNRMAEGRVGNRPRMSDLRESGAIEQDADVVLLLHREEYYKREDASVQGIAEVIVEKQRNGPTGLVKLHFNKQLTRFDNLTVNPTADAMAARSDEAPF